MTFIRYEFGPRDPDNKKVPSGARNLFSMVAHPIIRGCCELIKALMFLFPEAM